MILAVACVVSVLVSAAAFVLSRRQTQAQLLPIGPTDLRGERRRRARRLLYLGALALVAAVGGLLAWTVDGGTSHPPALPGQWESSGIIWAGNLVGGGWWLTSVQAHTLTAPQPGPTLAPNSSTGEDGQLDALFVPNS